MLRRLLILMPGLLASSVALLQLGCGDDVDESRNADDMGLEPTLSDGSTPDLSPPSAEDDGYPANADASFDLEGAANPTERSSCYAEASSLDCASPLCEALPVCCVGATRAGCCAADDRVPSVEVGGDGCTSIACLGDGARAFGVPGPTFVDGLVAGGDVRGDGGVVYEPAIDGRSHTIAIEGTIAPPTADCADGCFETIALALLGEAPPSGEVVLVRPAVAVRYAGATDRVVLEAGGEVLHRFSEAPAGRWRLEVEPDGTLRVSRDGSPLLTLARRVVSGLVYPAVLGRTRNPSASGGEAARLTQLAVRVDTCDIPTGWARGAAVAFTEAPSAAVGRPSLRIGDPTLLAVDDDEELRLFRESVSGRFDPIALTGGSAIRDPQLVSARRLVAVGEDGVVLAGDLDDPITTVTWTELLPACNCERRSPTLATAFDGTPVLMVLEDGRPRVFAVAGDAVEVPELGARVDALTAPMADERRTGLALALRNDAWHLHVTYARGTRSVVRLFVSEELVVWRDLGTVFEPSGEGFDALQVWDFSVATGRDEGRLRAVYRGTDGVDATLGTTTRPAP